MNTDTLPVTPGPMPPEWVDIMIVLGVILAVALAVFFWAVIFRKEGKTRHKHHHHHHHHRTSYREQFKIGVGGIKELFRRHRHRRHRHHRQINPTLAETGGLPPLREPDKPPPPPPP